MADTPLPTAMDGFALWARAGLDTTLAVGRYSVQRDGEKLMPRDVLAKLELGPRDRLLDIGCGLGANLVPLSFLVAHATGVDHADVVKRLTTSLRPPNVDYVAGDFLEIDLPGHYTKILAYSVLQYVATVDRAMAFAERAFDLLEPGGRLLLADLPNVDLRTRHNQSPSGEAFARHWNETIATARARGETIGAPLFDADAPGIAIDDAFVLAMLRRFRRPGANAWLLPQPVDLPFGRTREDLLIVKY